MRYGNYLSTVALAGLATAALAAGALAQSAPAGAAAPSAPAAKPAAAIDPDAQIQINQPKVYTPGISGLDQRGCETSDKVYGTTPIPIDGYLYGGCLAKGADKNLDAVRELIKASQATGQFRNVAYGFASTIAVYLVIGDTTTMARMEGSGTWQGEKVNVRMDWDYRVPGMRLYITHANKQQDIYVAADTKTDLSGRVGHLEQPELFGSGPKDLTALASWKEKPAGVYAGPSDMSAQDLLALMYIMPSNVVLEGRDAADKIKASKVGRLNSLTIPVAAFGGTSITANLDADGHPVHTQMVVNGHTYTGDFSNYQSDRADFEVYLPHQITIQEDGKTIADWQIDFHHMNPYLIFPVPTQVAAKQ